MKDIRYLLSIKELLDESTQEALLKVAYEKLDSERRRKLENITNEKKRAESIGAGLLLQLAIQERIRAEENDVSATHDIGIGCMRVPEALNTDVQLLTISQVLTKLGVHINIEYNYSENGKPAFSNFPWHFNLSHSGEYVFLVLSEQEVGVDIQYKRSFYNERILRRFFTREEQELWETFEVQEDREEFFYGMWVRKEAYGKLTGEGIARAVSENVTEEAGISKLGVCFEHYDIVPAYRMAICKWSKKKE